MRNIVVNLEYGGDNPSYYKLYGLGDLHGGGLIDERLLDRTIAEINEDDHARWIGMGDYAEFINRRDRRFNPDNVAQWALNARDMCGAQRDWVVAKLRPIADKSWGLIEGNHERKILEVAERDIYEDIYLALGIVPLGYSSTICAMFRRNRGGTRTLPIYVHHGLGASSDNEERALHHPIAKLWRWPNARVCLMGHLHTNKHVLVNKTFITRSGLKDKVCLAARTGTFLRGTHNVDGDVRAGYAEIRAYQPQVPGAFYFYFRPEDELITTDLGRIT